MTGQYESIDIRFRLHYQQGTFDEYEEIEAGILFNKLTKKKAEIFEALLIISAKKGKLINNKCELKNLQQLDNKEVFHERVARFHEMSLHLLKNRWSSIKWTKYETNRDKPTTSSTPKRTTKAELLIKLEKSERKRRFDKTRAFVYREERNNERKKRKMEMKRKEENGEQILNNSLSSRSTGPFISSPDTSFYSEGYISENETISEDETDEGF